MPSLKLSTKQLLVKKSADLLDWQKSLTDTRLTIAPGQKVRYFFLQGLGNYQPRRLAIHLRQGSGLELYGLTLGWGQQRLEADITVRHQEPQATSRLYLKAVLAGEAQAKLNGIISIEPQGQLADARLEERVLLLSSEARAQTVPNLEIAANDVKASHAATVSHIDPEEIFYLQTRGLPTAVAERLIIQAFVWSHLTAWPEVFRDAKLNRGLTLAWDKLTA